MNLMNRVITGGYWVAYYLVYALGVVYLTCHFRRELPFLVAGPGQLDLHQLFILAAIFAVAGGTALFVAINVEVTGRMVLLIPKAWNRAKAEGRAEGRTEGRAEGLTEGLTQGLTQGHTEEKGPDGSHPLPLRAARPDYRGTGPGPGRRGTPAQRQRQRPELGPGGPGRPAGRDNAGGTGGSSARVPPFFIGTLVRLGPAAGRAGATPPARQRRRPAMPPPPKNPPNPAPK